MRKQPITAIRIQRLTFGGGYRYIGLSARGDTVVDDYLSAADSDYERASAWFVSRGYQLKLCRTA